MHRLKIFLNTRRTDCNYLPEYCIEVSSTRAARNFGGVGAKKIQLHRHFEIGSEKMSLELVWGITLYREKLEPRSIARWKARDSNSTIIYKPWSDVILGEEL